VRLTSLLDEKTIRTDLRATTRAEAIQQLLDLLYERFNPRPDRRSVLQMIMDRESLGGTAFPSGIAIPHARIPEFDDLLIAIGVPRIPIPSESGDIRMVVLILTSKTASRIYLKTLAALVRLSQDPGLFGRLLAAADPPALLAVLRQANIQVEQALTVRDIMSPAVPQVRPDTTLKELADLMYKHATGYAPVVDEGGRFVGEVNMLDLLQVGIPDYARKIGNLSFLHSFEPFEELLEREERLQVREIMRKPLHLLDPDDPVIHAAFVLHRHRRQHLPVVRKGSLVGIVSFMDILTKVLRG
jgi:CBS domain-containing protein